MRIYSEDKPVKRSSLLLAGGLGTRMNGREKALMMLGDSTLLERSLEVLDSVSEEVIVSLRDEDQLREFSAHLGDRKVVFDKVSHTGPLAGMLAGFEKATGEYVFTVACDMPFLNGVLIDMMFGEVCGHDALIPIGEHGLKEPLHAVYRRGPMLRAMISSLEKGRRSVLDPVFSLDDVIYKDPETIKKLDKGLKSFVNINTPSDMAKLDHWHPDGI